MHMKRMIMVGVAHYGLLLLSGIIISLLLHSIYLNSSQIMAIVGIVLSLVITWVCGLWYVRGLRHAVLPYTGYVLGLTIIIVGCILDFLLVLPSVWSFSQTIEIIESYYSQVTFWITLISIEVVSVYVVSRNHV